MLKPPEFMTAQLYLAADGAEHRPAALKPADVENILDAVVHLPVDTAGVRITGIKALRAPLDTDGVVGTVAASALGAKARPVRAVLFDKGPDNNWNLAWHQDRTVIVRERREVAGYGPWSIKSGLQHVAPPEHILSGMVTLRVHLDPVDEDNAPLLIAPGSHRLGRIPEAQVPDVVERLGVRTCLAEVGDIWLYSTLIIHASEASRRPRRRRVLQVDYSATELDGGLEWLGV
jgi:hypothetical protein